MPMYQYYCEKCDRNFGTIVAYKNRKRRRKCVNCGDCGCPHTWDYSKSDDKGIGGIRGGDTPKFYGSTQDKKVNDNRWLEKEIKNTANAIKGETGVSPYSRMTPNYEELTKQGRCVRTSEAEGRKKMEKAAEATRTATNTLSKAEKAVVTRPDKQHSN
jgi:hypothetical protein